MALAPATTPAGAVSFEIVTKLGAPIAIRDDRASALQYAREIIATFPGAEVFEVITPAPIRRRIWRERNLQLVRS